MVGSAVSHDHELVLGTHSVHTSATALREAEAQISEIGTRSFNRGQDLIGRAARRPALFSQKPFPCASVLEDVQ